MPPDHDYDDDRLRDAVARKGRKMVVVRCAINGCSSLAAEVFESPHGPLVVADAVSADLTKQIVLPDKGAGMRQVGRGEGRRIAPVSVTHHVLVDHPMPRASAPHASCRTHGTRILTEEMVRSAVAEYRAQRGSVKAIKILT